MLWAGLSSDGQWVDIVSKREAWPRWRLVGTGEQSWAMGGYGEHLMGRYACGCRGRSWDVVSIGEFTHL